MSDSPSSLNEPTARLRRSKLSLIWLIPLFAAAIGLWLGVQALHSRGPLITLTLRTANGITAGQTQVKHKAVALGTVEDVALTDDLSQVKLHIRMTRQSEPFLTDQARFWVVRPRLTPGNISGLETLVSGAYIEVDPGERKNAKPNLDFTGLEEPPSVRSDEPGRSFVLKADRIGSLGPGSPVFYRDVNVGEVLGYDLGDLKGPFVTVNVFVRAPYDKYVTQDSHFWNASGISVGLLNGAVHVEIASLQAVLSGGVAFNTSEEGAKEPSPAGATFRLFNSHAEADAAGFRQNIPFVTYFTSPVGGLARGAPVQVFGMQVGEVQDVKLDLDPMKGTAKVKVEFEIQPERVFSPGEFSPKLDPFMVTEALVKHGMRAQLQTSNFLTGQQTLAMTFVPGAPPADLGREGDTIVMPSQPGGGLDAITAAATDIAGKLDSLPLQQIASNLNDTLHGLSERVNGPELRDALHSVSEAMESVRELTRNADQGLSPALKRLPEIAATVQSSVERANHVLGSVDSGYGANSDFARNLSRLMDQINETARSIRLLADFIDRHPEALIRGRTEGVTER